MATLTAETNLHAFEAAPVASHYASLNYLSPCERLLFDSYIKPGSAILDLGVGGGRTTAWLAARASKYVGVDYARAMVEACQRKFPQLKFIVGDASDLSDLAADSFDVVVFAFNGLDYVLPAAARHSCLQHIWRVLKPNGVVVFSSHNPRAIVRRRSWNRERLQTLARRLSIGPESVYRSLLAGLVGLRCIWAFFHSAGATLLRSPRIFSSAFWQGEGCIVDSEHGGLLTHCWIPRRVIEAMNAIGFRVERVVSDDYPRSSWNYSTDWYYYVFLKSEEQVLEECA
jgi:SAM-dependent methyltransferase